jgi:hypothetical protein
LPKSKRVAIRQRGLVEVNDSAGQSGVPAARWTSSDSGSGREHVSSTGGWNALTAFSSTLKALADQAEKAEQRAYNEAQKQENRAYNESLRQRHKAEERAEAMADAAAVAGLVSEHNKIMRETTLAHFQGQLTSHEQVDDIAERYGAIINSSSNPGEVRAAAAYQAEFYKFFTPMVSQRIIGEQVNLANKNLANTFEGIFSSRTSFGPDQDANLWQQGQLMALESYKAAHNGSDVGFNEAFWDAGMATANSRVGTEVGDGLRNQFQRMIESEEYDSGSPANAIKILNWFKVYDEEAKKRDDAETAKAREEEGRAQTKAQVSHLGMFLQLENAELQNAEIARLLTNNGEEANARFGEGALVYINKLQEHVKTRTAEEERERQVKSTGIRDEWIQNIRTNPGKYTLTDISNIEGLDALHTQELINFFQGIHSELNKNIDERMNKIYDVGLSDMALYGSLTSHPDIKETRGEDGTRSFQIGSSAERWMKSQIEARVRELETEIASTDVSDPVQRRNVEEKRARLEAEMSASMRAGRLLEGYKSPEPVEAPLSVVEQAAGLWANKTPENPTGTFDGETYNKLTEDEKRLLEPELQRIQARNMIDNHERALAAQREQQRLEDSHRIDEYSMWGMGFTSEDVAQMRALEQEQSSERKRTEAVEQLEQTLEPPSAMEDAQQLAPAPVERQAASDAFVENEMPSSITQQRHPREPSTREEIAVQWQQYNTDRQEQIEKETAFVQKYYSFGEERKLTHFGDRWRELEGSKLRASARELDIRAANLDQLQAKIDGVPYQGSPKAMSVLDRRYVKRPKDLPNPPMSLKQRTDARERMEFTSAFQLARLETSSLVETAKELGNREIIQRAEALAKTAAEYEKHWEDMEIRGLGAGYRMIDLNYLREESLKLRQRILELELARAAHIPDVKPPMPRTPRPELPNYNEGFQLYMPAQQQ